MHTPDQARELWCPMVRIARREVNQQVRPSGLGEWREVEELHLAVGGCNTDALGGNRVPASCRCIADKCAMWRWGAGVDPNWKKPAKPPASFAPPPLVRSTHGYCGIGGRPEVTS